MKEFRRIWNKTETEIENKTDALKQTEEIVRKQIRVIEKSKLELKKNYK